MAYTDAPPLACHLRRKEVLGRQGPIPNMGEVELENCSGAPLQIEYTMTPLPYLQLEVFAVFGERVSEGYFSDRFSPMAEPAVLTLMPGEKFATPVALLATLPRQKRLPSRYTVQASYCFQGNRVMAAPLTIELHDEPCTRDVLSVPAAPVPPAAPAPGFPDRALPASFLRLRVPALPPGRAMPPRAARRCRS